MNKKSNISVVMATFNEEPDLQDCLESLSGLADQIIVVDGSSTDKTVQIAKKYGADVTVTINPPNFHLNKQLAIEKATNDWVLLIDADERITPELKSELLAIGSNGKPKKNDPVGYWVKRKKIFLGKPIRKGGQYPDPDLRFFLRGKGRQPAKSVHEKLEVEGKLGWLNGELIHLPTPSFFVYLTKDNRYSSLEAQELLLKNPGRNLLQVANFILWKPIKTLFSLFIRHKGYEDGFPGFVFALYSGVHHASSYIKYWEAKETGEKDITKDWV